MQDSSWDRWKSPTWKKIEGLSPAISIDQKSTNRNPRSTVGTVTEIYDYFRLFICPDWYPHCPKCGKEIKKQTVRSDGRSDYGPARRFQDTAAGARSKRGGRASMPRCWNAPKEAATSV